MTDMQEYAAAADLPEAWDENADNPYMRRAFLHFMENASDNLDIRYCILADKGHIAARFVLFRRTDYPIAQFSSFDFRGSASFVYVPLSVSNPGLILSEAGKEWTFDWIRRLQGLKLVMNLPGTVNARGFTSIRTCPKCVLRLRWNSFEDYLRSLRSGYRARYKKALLRSAPLRLRRMGPQEDLSTELHALYAQVHDRARYKIERLRPDFFRGSFFTTFVLETPEGRPTAFFQLLENGRELIFVFAGLDYAVASRYDVYVRILLEITRYGLEQAFERIDFGQTAEDAKLKLGCVYEQMFILVHHSNPLLNLALRLSASLLQYKPIRETRFHVFNSCGEKA